MTARKLFSTDGIRGRANQWPMTPEVAMKVAMAVGSIFNCADRGNNSVVIGKDTRLSGYTIEMAMIAGFTSVGFDVFMTGPIPTPAIAMLTRSLRCDAGVVISASHNPYHDNGIKIFGPGGYKLSDELEHQIECFVQTDHATCLAPADRIGRAKRIEGADNRYIEFVKRTVPHDVDLSGMKVVLDCANGAGYRVAPAALWELGVDVIEVGTEPNGFNINLNCGSTSTEMLSKTVLEKGADIGIALDGDADRIVLVDEQGAVINGDQVIATISKAFLDAGRLSRDGIVTSIMSNLGLERYLSCLGLTLARTKVGDRHVVAHMLEHGYNVGGEQSGHIVLSDHTTTGDGVLTALQLLSILQRAGKPASEIGKSFDLVPQVIKNVQVSDSSALENNEVKSVIGNAKKRLGSNGRLIVRPSGTEALVRVMAEGDDSSLLAILVDDIVESISQVASV